MQSYSKISIDLFKHLARIRPIDYARLLANKKKRKGGKKK